VLVALRGLRYFTGGRHMNQARKKPPANPVTQEGRDAFAMFVHKWQDALNLNDWRIQPSSKPAAKANMAEVFKFDLEARLATYRIGEDFGGTPVTAMSVEDTALHEVLHVFLYELLQFAQDPAANPADIASAEHRVIHSLVRVLTDRT
jgi:hypothetical protein